MHVEKTGISAYRIVFLTQQMALGSREVLWDPSRVRAALSITSVPIAIAIVIVKLNGGGGNGRRRIEAIILCLRRVVVEKE